MSKKTRFDANAFYAALDGERRARKLTWKKVADGAGVSASTLTRMAQGSRLDVDTLAALTAWSGLQTEDFVRAETEKENAEPLAMISTYLKADRNLSAGAAEALDQIIKTTYEQLREKD